MASRPDPWDAIPLLDGILLEEEPSLGHELAARLPGVAASRAVSVTDLLDPRRAFWRRVRGPAPISVDRQVRMERGRAWHRAFGDAVAGEGRLEVRVRRGGLSARIDLLADVPVEIKTAAPVASGAAPEDWPEQLEQLAAYCVLAGADRGRLAHVSVGDDGPPQVSVSDVRFGHLARFRPELGERERLLREALGTGRPDGLERCRWVGRGCEFREAGICDCTGNEDERPPSVAGRPVDRAPRPDLAERWTKALATAVPPSAGSVDHYRDLLYPRRAYFERTSGRPPAAHPPRPPAAPLDAYERTVAALEEAAVGDVHRLPAGPGAPGEDVLGWNGVPCLVRALRVHQRLSPEEVRSRFPQYLLDLGFRCAATGTTRARLVVGYEYVRPGEPSVQVFGLRIEGATGKLGEALRLRGEEVAGALEGREPRRLPVCPGWMSRDCPYRDACGCSEGAGRSQR